MQQKFYMSVDGGGAKLAAVLYDDAFRLVGYGRGGSVNPNDDRELNVAGSMKECIARCLGASGVTRIERIDVTMPGDCALFRKLTETRVTVRDMCSMTEGNMCILAGLQRTSGIIALSGTGSGVFSLRDTPEGGELEAHIGGWGGIVGDEGSGYDIGRKGINAALRSNDGRGARTVLEQTLLCFFGTVSMGEAMSRFYRLPSQKAFIASFARVVAEHAEDDSVSRGIVVQAGEDMADQVDALFSRIGERTEVVIAGGVWKNNPYMVNSFRKAVCDRYPETVITPSLYEPVMGGVVKQAVLLPGTDRARALAAIAENFGSFRYTL